MADFGAEVAGVRRLLPSVAIPDDSDSVPDAKDVAAFLGEFTAEVARRLGDLSTLSETQRAEVDGAARRLVHWAVAATVYDAHFPERAGLTDESYGAVLWDRYRTGLDELAEELEVILPEEQAGDPGVPGYSFPEPAFPDNLAV